MSASDDAEIRAMIEVFAEAIPAIVNRATGPISDLVRASTNATVDALIDAREKMLEHHWPEELADVVIVTIINRNADVQKKVAEVLSQANATRQAKSS